MRLTFRIGRLDGNHHGRKIAPGEWETRRSGFLWVALGRDSWLLAQGRKLVGRRLWIYGPSGACVNIDVYALFDRCLYPAGTKYGPRPVACYPCPE